MKMRGRGGEMDGTVAAIPNAEICKENLLSRVHDNYILTCFIITPEIMCTVNVDKVYFAFHVCAYMY